MSESASRQSEEGIPKSLSNWYAEGGNPKSNVPPSPRRAQDADLGQETQESESGGAERHRDEYDMMSEGGGQPHY
jgi:hypothetical protein